MYLADLMEKSEAGQFIVLSYLQQHSTSSLKDVMSETGFSKATLTKYISLINDKALKESQAVYEADQDERAKEAAIRYESRLDAYQFLLGKFANYQAGKGFHDLPDGLLGERNY